MIVSNYTLTDGVRVSQTPLQRVRQDPSREEAQKASSVSPPAKGVISALVDGRTVLAAQESNRSEPSIRRSSNLSPGQGTPNNNSGANGELTPQEQAEVRALKQRDAEVRRHEQAHKLAAGPYAGPTSFEYVRGPDGQQYAVGGEVQIDVGREGSPEATIRKMEVIIRAAAAPADPSSQDRAVAAQAKQILQEAQAERREETAEEQGRSNDPVKALIDRAIKAYGRLAEDAPYIPPNALFPQAFNLIA